MPPIDLQPIKDSIKRAPRGQQAELASWILEQLGPADVEDEELERAWELEVERRVEEIRTGKAQLISKDDFFAELRGRGFDVSAS